MRVLFIYSDYHGRRSLYGKMIAKLGHEVVYKEVDSKVKRNTLTYKIINKVQPDLIWLSNPFFAESNSQFMEFAKSRKIPTTVYGTFNVAIPYTDWKTVWNKIDLIFIHHKECCDWLKKQSYNAHYMPQAFYPNMYYKTSLSKKMNISCKRKNHRESRI